MQTQVVIIKVVVKLSFWSALKMRLAGIKNIKSLGKKR
jgi:hypothetical protein